MLPYKVAFKTLGCKLNQAETESLATGFQTLGWEIVNFGETADAVVVNSCTVTNAADRKSRSAMNQALKIVPAVESDNPLVVMTGCYVDGYRDKLEAEGRTYVVGNNHKSHIPQLIDAHFRGEIITGYPESERDPFGYPLAESIFRTRALVKVQDGCDNFCTFCIIPFVRGRGTSRPLFDTVEAVTQAAASGYREIVLTGVNMSRWEEGDLKFADLVRACLDAPGDFRLRLGSVEPDRIDNSLLDLMTHPKMTPHLHLCLQSGSEKVLRAMRRQYTAAEFVHIAGELRRRVPGFNLTTDLIVGFPGETKVDFSESLALCERLGFGHIHTFPYSRRNGTRADRMDSHISAAVKKSRAEAVRKVSVNTKRAYRSTLIGSLQDVLVEKTETQRDGTLVSRGFSASYVPVSFSLPASCVAEGVQNCIFQVHIDRLEDGDDPDLLGRAVSVPD
jgi:threonylcarbamoyladenosine tRNA methylthiotransferase MtaB